jgi:abortive infection bacteriophage resistance protein
MGNKATNTTEQIEKLKSRGMILDGKDSKIEEVLLDIGYYRLGFYWFPFSNPQTHDFITNIKFSDVLSLYYFDTDLKNILIKYLTRFEINLRTKLIYEVSNHYPTSPTWFIDPNVVNKDFIDSFDRYYSNDFKRNNSAIKKHHEKYLNDKYAPAWKTIEFLTFGSILKLYSAIKSEDLKAKIAEYYEVKRPKVFEAHVRTVLNVRNICAHNGVLFDYRPPKGIKQIPDLDIDHKNRNTLEGVLKLISFYLGKISMNRKNEFDDSIETLKRNLDLELSVRGIIAQNLGF